MECQSSYMAYLMYFVFISYINITHAFEPYIIPLELIENI